MTINERQIALRTGAGTYPALNDYLDRRRVMPIPFNETSKVVAAGVDVMKLDNTMITPATTIAKGTGTTENGGLFCTELIGAVGTGATDTDSDSLGNILNMVELRDATTHDPIVTSGDREVYGLIQCSNGVADGAAIGAPTSENVQVSFVYVTDAGVITLVNVTATVEFVQNNVYLARYVPSILLEGGSRDQDAMPPITADQGEYVVTTAFVAAEVITLSNGNGAGSGLSTKTGETINLGANAAAFQANNLLQVMLNGVEQRKETDVIWDTSGSFHFALALDVGDYFEVRLLAN